LHDISYYDCVAGLYGRNNSNIHNYIITIIIVNEILLILSLFSDIVM